MRHIFLGAGAVGGTLGGLLAAHGHDTVLVARGDHLEALRAHGLTLRTPGRTISTRIAAIGSPAEIELRADDVLILAVKTQDSQPLLAEWSARPVEGGGTAGERLPIVCAQNGVENERLALRWFARVLGVCLWLPTSLVKPGEVAAFGAPLSGMLHVGRFPRGTDAACARLAANLSASGVLTHVSDDVMRWKWAKLVSNLANSIEALAGSRPGSEPLIARVEAEGIAVLEAAGIDRVGKAEEQATRGEQVNLGRIDGLERDGGSSWQSLARGAGVIESDYLNGEIARLGREIGLPTPISSGLQRLANQAARERWRPGHFTPDALARLLDVESTAAI